MNGENSNDTVITESTMNVNVKQELVHHEQGNAGTVSSAQSDGRSSVMSLPNIPCITKQQIEDRSERFFGIRNGVEDKSRQLSDVWSELYNLLGQYKSELFSVEVANQSFNGMDSGQLKQEVLQRDNMIYERDSEITELRSQLEQLQQHIEELQNHSEQCRLDVDTKDRLINQYQQDLMEKDTQLLTANTKVGRLENRLKMLESRVPQPMPQSPVPRKVVRTPQSMRGMAMSPVRGRGRASPMGLGAAGRLAQAGVGRFSPAVRMGPGAQQMRRRPVQQQQQQALRRPAQPHLVPPPAVMPTPVSQPSAVVCIEVDDDDDQSQDVKPNIPTNQTTPTSSPMKTESKESVQSYLQSLSQENNGAQGGDMKPGFSEHFDVNQPMMSQMELEQMEQSFSQGPSSGDTASFSKSERQHLCTICQHVFTLRSSLQRHVKIVHMDVREFVCHQCGHRCSRKEYYYNHMFQKHKMTREHLDLFKQTMNKVG